MVSGVRRFFHFFSVHSYVSLRLPLEGKARDGSGYFSAKKLAAVMLRDAHRTRVVLGRLL